eukprot:TRINITY_DN12648_c1_g1_i1.p1 TRINITY_DN12648_c1_g1~~TRINITY_DN12648_c1_g1_i1.p1  ORF type:complete len:618 (+),score=91.43 TRINITY_DN12648_c1_g1_i1:206-2059(+)
MPAHLIPELVLHVESATGLTIPAKAKQDEEGKLHDVFVVAKTRHAQPKRQKTKATNMTSHSAAWGHDMVFRNFSRAPEVTISVHQRSIVLGKGTCTLIKPQTDAFQETINISLEPTGTLRLQIEYRNGRPLFESSLKEVTDREATKVPLIVQKCCRAVEQHGGALEGIYRVPGLESAVNELQSRFETDPHTAELTDADTKHITSVASLVKRYLRSLPEPLLTAEHQAAFIAAANNPNVEQGKAQAVNLLRRLPSPSYHTTLFLMRHLQTMLAYRDITKMNIDNFALIFGPSMTRVDVADMSQSAADNLELMNQLRKPSAGNVVVKFLLEHPDIIHRAQAQRDASSTSFDLSRSRLDGDRNGNGTINASEEGKSSGAASTTSDTLPLAITALDSTMESNPHYASPLYSHVDGGQSLADSANLPPSVDKIIRFPKRTPVGHAPAMVHARTVHGQFVTLAKDSKMTERGLRMLCLQQGLLLTPREAQKIIIEKGSDNAVSWLQLARWWPSRPTELSPEARKLLKDALELMTAYGMLHEQLTRIQWEECCANNDIPYTKSTTSIIRCVENGIPAKDSQKKIFQLQLSSRTFANGQDRIHLTACDPNNHILTSYRRCLLYGC